MKIHSTVLCVVLLAVSSVQAADHSSLNFHATEIADDVNWWWAITVADVNDDGIQDLLYIDTNSTGGRLGYRVGSTGGGHWEDVIVAETAPDGRKFASGDLETGDFDGDGDVDLIGVSHPGEWADASATAQIYWYENPSWKAHPIGESLGAVKDLSVADFDADGRLDLAVLNFHNHQLRVYQQQADGSFAITLDSQQEGLHEGMDVGDLDGDGDPDIAANGYAFLNPGDITEPWAVETIDSRWHNQDGDWSQDATKNACADINGDGKDEVFISHSERSGYPVAYYTRSEEGEWTATVIADSLPAAHTLQVADMDLDGDLDVVSGVNKDRAWNLEIREFPVNVYLNDGTGESFESRTILEGGIYNGRVADFEGDGDFDLFRLNGHEAKTLELHINQPPLAADRWTHIQVDDQKAMWGDFDEPEWLRYFGLDMGDIDNDGDLDLITGRNLYLNPGGDMQSEWTKLDLDRNVDAMLFYDAEGNGSPTLIAEALPDVWEFKYRDGQFTSQVIGQIPATGHHNGQGYRVADVVPGGKPEILLASLGGIFLLEVGADGKTRSLQVGKDASDEGFDVADIDGDGDLDLAAGFRIEGEDPENPLAVVWFENPGAASENWTRHAVGMTEHAVDRVEIADFDGDGKADIAVAEERYPGLEPDASLWVFLQRDSEWERSKVVTQYSMNNLDAADMDRDGDIDLVTAEHKGPDLALQIWLNDGSARFSPAEVDRGKESHLGAQARDMDGDGDLDIVSIGWDRHEFVHLWRNDAISRAHISETEHLGRPHFKITTPSATYLYDPVAGGFSSIIDPAGKDWIAYADSPWGEYPASAATSFRGLPNLVHGGDDNGVGHPGFDKCSSEVISDHQIRTRSKSGQWQWTWSFFSDHARLDVETTDPDHPYWFLYEGPAGGNWQPGQTYWGSNLGGPNSEPHDFYNNDKRFDRFDWLYFGTQSSPHVFWMAQPKSDEKLDLYSLLGSDTSGIDAPDGMVVAGFGRGPDTTPLLEGTKRFLIGMHEFREWPQGGAVGDAHRHQEITRMIEAISP